MKTITLSLRNLTNRSPLRAFLLISFALACFALSPIVRAVLPEPGGGYPNNNTALGEDALFNLDTSQGTHNTAIGFDALYQTTTGYYNTATGSIALFSNTTGDYNTANGISALYYNTTGEANTALGSFALVFNTVGSFNTATGNDALKSNTTGSRNTANGFGALKNNTTGTDNIALGYSAGFYLTTGSNNIDIGNVGVAGESGKIRIGSSPTHTATFIAGINGAAIGSGVPVRVSASGQLGTQPSSARFKKAIKPMDKASEAILALKPVTFNYKRELDPDSIPQFGLVAEDVEKVNPDLVARDAEGKPYTVRYEAVNAMLLNEFLKEHQKVQRLEAALAAVNERLKAQDAKIDKVNAKVEMSKPALPMVVNNQ